MNRLTTRLVIGLLLVTSIVGLATTWTLAVRTALPGAEENAVLISRVEAYLEARIRAERGGFAAAAVRPYLAGDALADAEAFEASDPAAVEGLEPAEPIAVVVLIRGGTTALVQAAGTLRDVFGEQPFAEQYLMRAVPVDGETAWMIESVFRLVVSKE
jgi:hypothetical protein